MSHQDSLTTYLLVCLFFGFSLLHSKCLQTWLGLGRGPRPHASLLSCRGLVCEIAMILIIIVESIYLYIDTWFLQNILWAYVKHLLKSLCKHLSIRKIPLISRKYYSQIEEQDAFPSSRWRCDFGNNCFSRLFFLSIHDLEQNGTNFFCQNPDSKHILLREPGGLFHNYSALVL